MSRICIIGASNIKHISLISLYTRYFDENSIDYDIIYMDRYGIEEHTNATKQYRYNVKKISNKISKLMSFISFRKFAKGIIKEQKYDLIITWQTTVAYIFADLLLRKYKHKYIINIRDYVVEDRLIFKGIIRKLIKYSAMNAISSEGFKVFLPKGDYTRVNSINDDILQNNSFLKNADNHLPYKIGFAGNCRYFKESFRLIDALANDERFEIWYCGTNSEILAKYAEEKGIKNVKTMPAFSPSETMKIFSEFDIVNSAFGNDAMDNSTLMPIRLYTAVSMHLPMLVSDKTQLAKEVGQAKIGYVIENYDNLGDKLFSYLETINYNDFSQRCDDYIISAREQNSLFYDRLGSIIEVRNG